MNINTINNQREVKQHRGFSIICLLYDPSIVSPDFTDALLCDSPELLYLISHACNIFHLNRLI